MKKGFSIVEVLVVIAVMAILGAGAIFSFASYRRHVVLNQAAETVVMLLENAKSKSIAGELKEGTTIDDYDISTLGVSALPVYFVAIDTGSKKAYLKRTYTDDAGATFTLENVMAEEYPIDQSLTINVTSNPIGFARSTGSANPSVITLRRGAFEGKQIIVSANGNINLTSL